MLECSNVKMNFYGYLKKTYQLLKGKKSQL